MQELFLYKIFLKKIKKVLAILNSLLYNNSCVDDYAITNMRF